MRLILTDGTAVTCDLEPDELYSLYTAGKKGAKVFVLIRPRTDGEKLGKVFMNLECIDCHKSLEDVMILDLETRDTPISPLTAPSDEQ